MHILKEKSQVDKVKVQKIVTDMGYRYLLVDNNYAVIDEVSRYLTFLDVCGKSPNTLRSYAYNLKLYYSYMRDKGYDPLKLFDNKNNKPIDILCSFMFWLQYPNTSRNHFEIDGEKCKRSNETVNTIMSTVLSFYQYLLSNNEISEMPVYKIQRVSTHYKSFLYEMTKHNANRFKSVLRKPEAPNRIEAITRDQYVELLHIDSSVRNRLLYSLLFEGGLRLGEALGLHLEDLCDLQDGIIKIVPRENNENGTRVKNYSAGIIKVPNYVVDLVLEYLQNRIAPDSQFLFLTSDLDKPLSPDAVEKLFIRISNKVGFKVRPHMLRHGFATEKLMAGWQMVDIQAYLRHKNISSTQIYVTYSDEMKKEIMRRFLDINEKGMEIIANELKTD